MGRQAEHRQHVRFLDLVAAEADELVQRRLGIAHGPLGSPGDGIERRRVDLDLLQPRNVRQVFGDQGGRDAPQIEPLAARQDGRQDLLRVRRGKHELHMLRRLLQRLEQRVEGCRREHVDFVNDVDLEARAGRGVFAGLAQLANLLHAVIAGAVDLEHVQRAPFGDFLAARVAVVEVRFGAAAAIEAFGEDAGDGGLAGAARAAKQVGVRNPLLLDRAGQRLRDVFLPHHVPEELRAIFASDDLITHTTANELRQKPQRQLAAFGLLTSAF